METRPRFSTIFKKQFLPKTLAIRFYTRNASWPYDGQAVELSGTGWADGIHRATVNDEHAFLINTSLPPNVGPGGQMRPVPAPVFYFYGVDAPQTYRVVTPELTGEWHQITTYIPPRIDKVRWKVTPPAYTQMDVIEQEGYKALKFRRAV